MRVAKVFGPDCHWKDGKMYDGLEEGVPERCQRLAKWGNRWGGGRHIIG